MPSVLEDPSSPPFLTHLSPLPVEIVRRQVVLKDSTVATVVPFSELSQVPPILLRHVCMLLNREIENGDTYPMVDQMSVESFGPYWFGNFGAVMLLGDAQSVDDLLLSHTEDTISQNLLGSFYIKPNYPGRSSHVCNAGFLVSGLARNRGIGKLLGLSYLEWAPKLGYSYSVFNLVYETNVASCRIWDSLGFKRIGRVKGCGNLRSFPNQLVDAIQYGRELGQDGEGEFESGERFDKIRYYLQYQKYPDGADRADKSRLRSAAMHYRLIPSQDGGDDRLMLKDKEVISNRERQLAIASAAHEQHHAGINKTTAVVAERYHWTGIKTTVSSVIKGCTECTREVPNSTSTSGDSVHGQSGPELNERSQ